MRAFPVWMLSAAMCGLVPAIVSADAEDHEEAEDEADETEPDRRPCPDAAEDAPAARQAVCWFDAEQKGEDVCADTSCVRQAARWCADAALDREATARVCFLAPLRVGHFDEARTVSEYVEQPTDRVRACRDALDGNAHVRVVTRPSGAEVTAAEETYGPTPVEVQLESLWWNQKLTVRFEQGEVELGEDAITRAFDAETCEMGDLVVEAPETGVSSASPSTPPARKGNTADGEPTESEAKTGSLKSESDTSSASDASGEEDGEKDEDDNEREAKSSDATDEQDGEGARKSEPKDEAEEQTDDGHSAESQPKDEAEEDAGERATAKPEKAGATGGEQTAEESPGQSEEPEFDQAPAETDETSQEPTSEQSATNEPQSASREPEKGSSEASQKSSKSDAQKGSSDAHTSAGEDAGKSSPALPPRDRSTVMNPLGRASLGLGAATGVISILSGIAAHVLFNQIKKDCDENNNCPSTHERPAEIGNSLAKVSTATTGIAIGFGAIGVALLVADAVKSDADDSTQVRLSPRSGEMIVRF